MVTHHALTVYFNPNRQVEVAQALLPVVGPLCVASMIPSLQASAKIEQIIEGHLATGFNYALACLGSAFITERSKELTDSEDPNTDATSGSSTIATAPRFI